MVQKYFWIMWLKWRVGWIRMEKVPNYSFFKVSLSWIFSFPLTFDTHFGLSKTQLIETKTNSDQLLCFPIVPHSFFPFWNHGQFDTISLVSPLSSGSPLTWAPTSRGISCEGPTVTVLLWGSKYQGFQNQADQLVKLVGLETNLSSGRKDPANQTVTKLVN